MIINFQQSIKLIVILCTMVFGHIVHAKINIINQCQVTPEIWSLATPPVMQKSNNLRRIPSTPEFAKGRFIVLEGILMDDKCVPIADAIVEIWQANSLGGVDYINDSSDKKDPNFVGTGTIITDNLGHYYFATIMPGSISNTRATHINLRIRHKDFLLFETVIYFENSNLNNIDEVLIKDVDKFSRDLLIAKLINSIDENKSVERYNFNITLDGVNKYKKY